MFPEGFLTYKQCRITSSVEPLQSLCAVAKKYRVGLLCGTIREHLDQGVQGGSYYQTSVYINSDGEIASAYRQLGQHASHRYKVSGTQTVRFKSCHGLDSTSLICIDAETPPVLQRALATKPQILFNPCHICNFSQTQSKEAMRKHAVGIFGRVLEEYCHRLNFTTIRCDQPFEMGAMGSSQVITPGYTLVPPSGKSGAYTVELPLNDSFFNFFRRTDCARSRREDNVGARIVRSECMLPNPEMGKIMTVVCRGKANAPPMFRLYTLFVLREQGLFAFPKLTDPWQSDQSPVFKNPTREPFLCFDTKDTGSVLMVCCESEGFLLARKNYELLHHVFEPNIRACFHTENGFLLVADRVVHVSVEGTCMILREERPWSYSATDTTVLVAIGSKIMCFNRKTLQMTIARENIDVKDTFCVSASLWKVVGNQLCVGETKYDFDAPIGPLMALKGNNAFPEMTLVGAGSSIFACRTTGTPYRIPGFTGHGVIKGFATRLNHIWAVTDFQLTLIESSYNINPTVLHDCQNYRS